MRKNKGMGAMFSDQLDASRKDRARTVLCGFRGVLSAGPWYIVVPRQGQRQLQADRAAAYTLATQTCMPAN
jgi:hypothetical protein